MPNGSYLYSKDKKTNQILNALAQPSFQDQFQSGAANGMFSVPTGGNHSYPAGDGSCLTEDELNIIIDYEEENTRLGNFDRIYPLQQNAAHYAKFFEYERPSNELLSKYLKLQPTEGTI